MSNKDYIVSTFKDGDCLVEYEHTELVSPLNSRVYITVTMPILTNISKVLEIHVTNESPRTTAYGLCHVTTSDNVVGFTLGSVAASTTLTVNVAAAGF